MKEIDKQTIKDTTPNALKRYFEDAEQKSDFQQQVNDSTLLLAVLNRFILDGLVHGYEKQMTMNHKDGDATHALMQSIGEQRVLYKFAKLFRSFGVDDHPLIKSASHTYFMGSVPKGD